MYLKIETADIIDEALTIVVDDVVVFTTNEAEITGTEEEQKEENIRRYNASFAKFQSLAEQLESQGVTLPTNFIKLGKVRGVK